MIRLFPARFNKYLILLLGFLLIMLAVFVYANIFRGTTMGPDILFIKNSKMVNGALVLNGSTASSANAFKDYSYKVQAGKLLLKVRYVPLVSRWHPTGDFNIKLSKQDLIGIREVYLYQDDNNKRLLWSQAEG
jgi:hypothetical protein